MAAALPEVPQAFKPIQHYLKTATEYEKRDPIVSYYCRLYAMQKGMDIDKKSPDCRNFLRVLMGLLEQMKTQLQGEDAIQSELVGQAHIEDAAVKLFFYADTEDRNSRFDKNVVKAFYTSSMLLDVLTTFGPLQEELEKSRKYAKWKAAYIHNCTKMGATPTPGPVPEASEELGIGADYQFQQPKSKLQNPDVSQANLPPQNSQSWQPEGYNPPPTQPYNMNQQINKVLPGDPIHPSGNQPPNPSTGYPHTTLQPTPVPRQANFEPMPQMTNNVPHGSFRLQPEDYAKALKYCKYANSALQYEDAPTAIVNLNRALKLLTTGTD